MRRPLVILFGLALLAATIGIPAWLLNRGDAVTKPPPNLDELDVVCTGRIDAAGKVSAIDPVQAGRVMEIHVAEGQQVNKGQALVSLDDRIYADAVKDAEAALGLAERERDGAKIKFDSYKQQLVIAQKRIDAAEAKVVGYVARLKQMKMVVGLGTEKANVTQADVDALQAEIDSANLSIEAERINLDLSRKYDPKLEYEVAQLRYDNSVEGVTRAKRFKDDCIVRAPADGTIVRLQTAVGATLVPGSPLDPAIVFAPAGPLLVRAEVEQADLGRVSVGMAAIVTDDSRREALTLHGKVKDIAHWIAPRKKMLMDPGDFNDVRTTEVIIELEPTKSRLWIGQRMLVRLVPGK